MTVSGMTPTRSLEMIQQKVLMLEFDGLRISCAQEFDGQRCLPTKKLQRVRTTKDMEAARAPRVATRVESWIMMKSGSMSRSCGSRKERRLALTSVDDNGSCNQDKHFYNQAVLLMVSDSCSWRLISIVEVTGEVKIMMMKTVATDEIKDIEGL